MEYKKIQELIKSHGLWLKREGGSRANLSYADLRGADLRGANLSDANLRGADLSDADLRGADLRGANLSDANLSDAYLSDANLSYADLRGADLSDANLSGANLRGANLSDADLRGADLDFSCMPLWCGDLTANYDDHQIIQQLYHVLSHAKHSTNASVELKVILLKDDLIELASNFRRARECNKL